MRIASSPKSGNSARSHIAVPILRLRYAPLVTFSLSLSLIADHLLADSDLVGLFFDRALCFGRPAGQTRSADSSPTGPNTIWRTPTWRRPVWTTTSSQVVAKPAAKQAAPGSESPSTTGRTTMRPKSSRAASWHLDAARVPPLHHLLGAEGRSVALPRVCLAAERRNPEAGRQPPGGRRRPQRRLASARR